MKFVDRVEIQVTGGTGGSGCCSFRRETFVPKGGPDGGDGGKGGSVYLMCDDNLSTLLDYRYKSHFKAARAQHGMGANKTGKSSDDIVLPVPPGTQVTDLATGEFIGELLETGDRLLVAKGGRGGRGNARFASPTHRTPREWEPGEEGEDRRIELVLKLLADVGLVGQPNAGKSTLLSVVSAARPKVAEYPFTTLTPQLGVVGLKGGRSFVMADVPGIIEGAHEGKGLGDRFLQHLERNRVLVYLVPCDSDDPSGEYSLLRNEVAKYSGELSDVPHFVVLSKADLIPEGEPLPRVTTADGVDVVPVSSVAGKGLDDLKERMWKLIRSADQEE